MGISSFLLPFLHPLHRIQLLLDLIRRNFICRLNCMNIDLRCCCNAGIKVKYLGGVPSSADLEQFAGHTHLYKGLWFGCTYEMWYGPDYDRYIPLEKIASFDDCSEKEIFENGTVRIKMYDSYDDFSKPESVRRAWGFRQHTDCDAAADYWTEEINKLIIARMEYQVEMEYGEFPHGGMCLMKAYLDENGKPITKSKAVKVHIFATLR